MHRDQWVGIAGAAAVVIGAFLPWIKGTSRAPVYLTIAGGVVIAVTALALLSARRQQRKNAAHVPAA